MTTATLADGSGHSGAVAAADLTRIWLDALTAAPRAWLAAKEERPSRPAARSTVAPAKSAKARPPAPSTTTTATAPTAVAAASWYRLPDFAEPAPAAPAPAASWYRTPDERAQRPAVPASPLDPFGLLAAFSPGRSAMPVAVPPLGALDPAAWAALLGRSALPADVLRLAWPFAFPASEPQLALPLPSVPSLLRAETVVPALPWLPQFPASAASTLTANSAPVPQIAFRTASGHAVARVVSQSATAAAAMLLAVAQVADLVGPYLPSEMLLPTIA
jgi:hypothetical protein